MKHKTAELEGALLDAAVVLALGNKNNAEGLIYGNFSTSWELGGPIIQRELIAIYFERYGYPVEEFWAAGFDLEVEQGIDWGGQTGSDPSTLSLKHIMAGPTPLIAAMRAFVSSKLGEEIELP